MPFFGKWKGFCNLPNPFPGVIQPFFFIGSAINQVSTAGKMNEMSSKEIHSNAPMLMPSLIQPV